MTLRNDDSFTRTSSVKVLPGNFEDSRQSLGFFFYRIEILYERFLLSEQSQNVRWPLIASVQCSPLMSLRRKFILLCIGFLQGAL